MRQISRKHWGVGWTTWEVVKMLTDTHKNVYMFVRARTDTFLFSIYPLCSRSSKFSAIPIPDHTVGNNNLTPKTP